MYRVTVVEKGAVPSELRRQFSRLAKASLMAAAGYWHDKYRPLHFTSAAYHRYPEIYGLREKKKRRPLYDTGETMRRSEKRDFRGTAKGVRAVYNLPKLNYFGSYRSVKNAEGVTVVKWMGPKTRMRREFTAYNAIEARQLQKVTQEAFMQQVGLLRYLKRTAVFSAR